MIKIKNAGDYRESLKRLKPRVYFMGGRIEDVVTHPATRPHVNSAAMTYALADSPKYEGLFTVQSPLTGEKINRFTHIFQGAEDLIVKVKMLRILGQKTGTCFQRCVGLDALNSLYSVTYEMDEKYKTEYHSRLKEYLKYVQTHNLMCVGGMTDPKGDRSLSPSKQADPDLYLRVVSKNAKGITIRGAKLHQTGAVNSHEIIVMPTIALSEEDRAYAVSAAMPTNTPGITMIFGRQSNDGRKPWEIDMGNPRFGLVGGEATIVFEDVFVPWERVFMCGEHEFSGLLVERFASIHRQNYGGCKGGVADVLIGASALIAEYQGVARASHIREKLTEMVHLTETLYGTSIAAGVEGKATPSGMFYVNPMLANVSKQNITRFMFEICRLGIDIAGGLLATMPSEADLKSPEVGRYVEKYFKGASGVPAEHRIRVARLIENMAAGAPLVEAMHGAGSPQAQRVMIYRQGEIEEKKRLALALAGIVEK